MKTRTWLFVVFATMVFGMFAHSPEANAQTAADSYWWHYQLSQSQRDANILTRAQAYADNTYVGVSCKVWIQSLVVPPASKYVAHIPLNSPYYDWLWQWGADVEAVGTDCWNRELWPPGQIIQAQVRTVYGGLSPHTMIIVWATPYGATFIECNWRGDGQVRRRYADWATLKAQMVHYTLYRVK